jgi:adenylate cyclase
MKGTWEGTVLLADVRVDAGKLYGLAGPARALETIQRSVDTLALAARAGGGQVIRAMGDQVMALFPTAVSAADAAGAMRDAVAALPVVATVKLGVRIAFHSGPLTVVDGDVLGKTVNLTEQLLKQANSEQILTSTGTAAGLDNQYKKRLRLLRPSETNASGIEVTTCEFDWRPAGDTPTVRLHANGGGYTRHLRLKYGLSELSTLQAELRLIRLGRDTGCHLSISEELASRDHCTIERRTDTFVLRDHSTNGTFISEDGAQEMRLQHAETVLGSHGWLALGQPRAFTSEPVEYFCE